MYGTAYMTSPYVWPFVVPSGQLLTSCTDDHMVILHTMEYVRGIVANTILRTNFFLVHTLQPVYTPLHFDLSHSATYSSPCA